MRRRSGQNLVETPVCVNTRLVASVPKGRVVVGCCHLWCWFKVQTQKRFTLPILSAEILRICSYAGDDQPIAGCPVAQKPEPKSLSEYINADGRKTAFFKTWRGVEVRRRRRYCRTGKRFSTRRL